MRISFIIKSSALLYCFNLTIRFLKILQKIHSMKKIYTGSKVTVNEVKPILMQ